VNEPRQFVFGYGSLVAEIARGHVATLRGHRRVWGVAMDNRRDLPGYKSYRLRADGSRPAVYVAFLDVEPAAGHSVTGLCVPVDEVELLELDRRERNYDRVEVTDRVEGARGRVWAYRGSEAGQARRRAGLAAATAVISRDYLRDVVAALAAIAPDEVEPLHRAADGAGLIVLDLERVEVPASPGRRDRSTS
jgi:hypothetical protein